MAIDDLSTAQPVVPLAKTSKVERSALPPPTPPKPKLSGMSSPAHSSVPMSGAGSNGNNTLGRGTSRKKKSAPPPPTITAVNAEPVPSGVVPKEKVKRNKSSGNLLEEKGYLTYKVKYFGKRPVKDFRGIDSTKSAIDQSKKAKAGSSHGPRTRFIILSEKCIKIVKRDGKVS
eukprot:maker-scaffold15_size728074-snap-gene-6.17 protein:Tk08874 transcript:maker-scaffold15_size728074-snap-gene-6.17-mRNA-1 annotation:"hypothetical protein FOTG_05348"